MNKSKLKTDWICVATSGYAVDGRPITEQELLEMAETYDLEFYAAQMWPEHRRLFNLGQVLAVKAEKQPNGEVKLFAQLAPNQQLIEYNQEGQYLYTSIEIAKNFRNTGKAYLFGLGVTDSPASVGTTQLQFFNVDKQGAQYGEFVKTDFAIADDKTESGLFSLLKRFFNAESGEENKHFSENNNNNEEASVDKSQVQAIAAAVGVAVGEQLKAFSAQFTPAPAVQPAEEVKAEEPVADTVSKADFNALSEKLDALSAKFNQLSQEQTEIPNGAPVQETTDFNVAV